MQLTKAFCDRFLPAHGDRTVDQMVQAARSVTANIAEGLTDGQTSFEVEIKLLGIAKGSLHELMRDYTTYLTHNGLADWGAHTLAPEILATLDWLAILVRYTRAISQCTVTAAPTTTWQTTNLSSTPGVTRRWPTRQSVSATS